MELHREQSPAELTLGLLVLRAQRFSEGPVSCPRINENPIVSGLIESRKAGRFSDKFPAQIQTLRFTVSPWVFPVPKELKPRNRRATEDNFGITLTGTKIFSSFKAQPSWPYLDSLFQSFFCLLHKMKSWGGKMPGESVRWIKHGYTALGIALSFNLSAFSIMKDYPL